MCALTLYSDGIACMLFMHTPMAPVWLFYNKQDAAAVTNNTISERYSLRKGDNVRCSCADGIVLKIEGPLSQNCCLHAKLHLWFVQLYFFTCFNSLFLQLCVNLVGEFEVRSERKVVNFERLLEFVVTRELMDEAWTIYTRIIFLLCFKFREVLTTKQFMLTYGAVQSTVKLASDSNWFTSSEFYERLGSAKFERDFVLIVGILSLELLFNCCRKRDKFLYKCVDVLKYD